MNIQLCDPDRLDAFVRAELNEQQESDLTAHLDQCASCGEELERRIAAADQWKEASQLLTHRRAEQLGVVDSGRDSGEHGSMVTSAAVAQQMEQFVDMLAPTDDPDMLGRIGGYEVSGVIGCGGMGVVFKAHDRSLDRVVAIKVMAPHLAGSGAARKRFARESKAAAAVLHPNVIAIHSVDADQKLPYLVMPYIGGESLQKRIQTEGPLCPQDTLRIGQQIAAGLAAAHAQGLVHRDIKPANILLERGVERVTITDFGLARAVDDATMTRSGVIAGTPQYMSPEQARGETIDHRSDLFSLGSVLYAMCTGHSPFRAETTFGVLRRITDNEPRPIREINPDVPDWLCAIIDKLHAKDASERFQSAEEVAELLEGCLAHKQQPTTTPLPPSVQKLPKSFGLHHSTTPAERDGGFRYPPIGKLIAAAAFAFLMIFAGVLIVLELNKGTLTIECDADDVPIRIMQGDKVAHKVTISKSAQDVRIAAGDYVVEVDGDFEGVTIKDGKVSLTRRGVAKVEITRNATLVLASNFQPENCDGLRFGERHERDDPRDRAYANYAVAEPGETKEIFDSFPTLGHGIEEVGLIVSVEPPHEPAEASNRQNYLVTAGGIRRIKNISSCEASVEGKLFFKPDDTPYTVGYFSLQLDGAEEENVNVDMIAGSAYVNISYIVGLPDEQLRKILQFDAPNKHSESWLSVNLRWRPQSAWASQLMELDGWEFDRSRSVPNMIQQQIALKPGETRTVSIEPAAAKKDGRNQNPILVTDTLESARSPLLSQATLEEMAAAYNEQTRPYRLELFTPPIPDLTVEQLRLAMLDGAKRYRRNGRILIAKALEETAKKSQLADRLRYAGMAGSYSPKSRQFTFALNFDEGGGYSYTMVVLPKAELRWHRDGWSSSTWGDIHKPQTGTWELESVKQSEKTLSSEAVQQWKTQHPEWSRIVIGAETLTMAGSDSDSPGAEFDLTFDYEAGPVPEYTISHDGEKKYAGVFMGDALIEDSKLNIAVDLTGKSKPKTFHTKDGVATVLTFHRESLESPNADKSSAAGSIQPPENSAEESNTERSSIERDDSQNEGSDELRSWYRDDCSGHRSEETTSGIIGSNLSMQRRCWRKVMTVSSFSRNV